MDFHFYPHDVQTCHVRYFLRERKVSRPVGVVLNFGTSPNPSRFESFSYNNKDLVFEWVEEGTLGSSNINNISLAQFNVFSGLVVIPTPIAGLDISVFSFYDNEYQLVISGDIRDEEL